MIKKINGTTIKAPSSCTWGFQDISSEESGRTLDGTMNIDRITSKIKFDCAWNALSREETATILNLVCPNVFIDVTYDDPLSPTAEKTKKFYTGDKSAPVHMWGTDIKMYTSLSFNFIEK